MKKKLAIIIGSGGQDGTLMLEFLKSNNYNIICISRQNNIFYGIDNIKKPIDILNKDDINNIIKGYMPDEIYYFAAYHHSSQDIVPNDDILFQKSTDIHVNGYLNILQSVSKYSPYTKICYASSCLIYGGTNTNIQNELTLPVPNSIYAITKLEGMHLGNWFAGKDNLHIINAILYNHESEFRSPKFVSMKIVKEAINISKGLQDKIVLGDTSKQVDWGYAGDYINAMHLLLQGDKFGDYIISSGELHTIQDLVEIVFNYLKLDWKKYVVVDYKIIQRNTGTLFGNNTKIYKNTGWKPKTGFEEMIVKMIESNL